MNVNVAPPLITLISRLRTSGGRSGGWEKQAMANTHTQCPRDTQDGWSLGQGSDAIFTLVTVAPTLIKLVGYEHREDAVGGGRSRQWQTHTQTMSP